MSRNITEIDGKLIVKGDVNLNDFVKVKNTFNIGRYTGIDKFPVGFSVNAVYHHDNVDYMCTNKGLYIYDTKVGTIMKHKRIVQENFPVWKLLIARDNDGQETGAYWALISSTVINIINNDDGNDYKNVNNESGKIITSNYNTSFIEREPIYITSESTETFNGFVMQISDTELLLIHLSFENYKIKGITYKAVNMGSILIEHPQISSIYSMTHILNDYMYVVRKYSETEYKSSICHLFTGGLTLTDLGGEIPAENLIKEFSVFVYNGDAYADYTSAELRLKYFYPICIDEWDISYIVAYNGNDSYDGLFVCPPSSVDSSVFVRGVYLHSLGGGFKDVIMKSRMVKSLHGIKINNIYATASQSIVYEDISLSSIVNNISRTYDIDIDEVRSSRRILVENTSNHTIQRIIYDAYNSTFYAIFTDIVLCFNINSGKLFTISERSYIGIYNMPADANVIIGTNNLYYLQQEVVNMPYLSSATIKDINAKLYNMFSKSEAVLRYITSKRTQLASNMLSVATFNAHVANTNMHHTCYDGASIYDSICNQVIKYEEIPNDWVVFYESKYAKNYKKIKAGYITGIQSDALDVSQDSMQINTDDDAIVGNSLIEFWNNRYYKSWTGCIYMTLEDALVPIYKAYNTYNAAGLINPPRPSDFKENTTYSYNVPSRIPFVKENDIIVLYRILDNVVSYNVYTVLTPASTNFVSCGDYVNTPNSAINTACIYSQFGERGYFTCRIHSINDYAVLAAYIKDAKEGATYHMSLYMRKRDYIRNTSLVFTDIQNIMDIRPAIERYV